MPYLSSDVYSKIHRFWQAANYLTVGQIYLQSNPLLKDTLTNADIKPRLLGHWGTSPGLSILYAHLNRCIKERDLDCVLMVGPGHGGPAIVACAYLESTYSEVNPEISEDEKGLLKLFRQFSTPGGIPSHVGPPTPGSIHEGGELGYVLSHAFGAVMDNPTLNVIAVVGDGEAETGPLEGAWKSINFINPIRDGAVLPVLHLNGYKIAGPTVLGREANQQVQKLLEAHGYKVYVVDGDHPETVHHDLAQILDQCFDDIKKIQETARAANKLDGRPLWPAIILRTPKGWTGPKIVDGKVVEGSWRSHQVPLSNVKDTPEHLKQLNDWMKSYEPENLFDKNGRLIEELRDLAPKGDKRMSATKFANGGLLSKPLIIQDVSKYEIKFDVPGTKRVCSTAQLGLMMKDIYVDNPTNFRLFCPDETNSNRLGAVFDVSDRCFVGTVNHSSTNAAFDASNEDTKISANGRVMEVLSEHLCEGWLEGYVLTGRHGLFASYEAFMLIVASMVTQHSKWLDMCEELPWRAPIPSLNLLLTSTCWRNDHNGFSHQGPGFMDVVLTKQARVSRIYLPPDANTLVSCSKHIFQSVNQINLLIIDKQPQLQYLTLEEAHEHCCRGASKWEWASNEDTETEPDVVIGCCGDVPTQEALAAAHWLRLNAPSLRVRFVNVVDLMSLYRSDRHPHGLSEEAFESLFGRECEVIFAFHGYPGGIKQCIHGRHHSDRFHVRGYVEAGTTTTPFDMVVLNEMSRAHLAKETLRRVKMQLDAGHFTKQESNQQRLSQIDYVGLMKQCDDLLKKHHDYVREKFDDLPEIRDWVFTQKEKDTRN